MKIQKLTIDDNELVQAVEAFLKTKGIEMKVHSVSKHYTWETESEVTFDFEVDKTPIPKNLPTIEPVQELISAEELSEKLTPTV